MYENNNNNNNNNINNNKKKSTENVNKNKNQKNNNASTITTTTNSSIVISGWPAVGKTTIASEIAKEFNFKLYNGGDILKMLAHDKGYSTSGNDWWDTEEAKKFMAERKIDPHFDRQVDKKLTEIVKKEKAVITSYTLPWLVEGPIKFWLKGSQLNRAIRMANRDNLSLPEAQDIIKMRDQQNKTLYRKLYGFNFGEDLTVFDFLINTDLMCLDPLVKISIGLIKNIIL
jgi:cytidylate kinase